MMQLDESSSNVTCECASATNVITQFCCSSCTVEPVWFAFTEGVLKAMSLMYLYRFADGDPSTRSAVSELRNGCLEWGAWLTLDDETTAAAVWDAPDFPPFSGLKERMFMLLQQCGG